MSRFISLFKAATKTGPWVTALIGVCKSRFIERQKQEPNLIPKKGERTTVKNQTRARNGPIAVAVIAALVALVGMFVFVGIAPTSAMANQNNVVAFNPAMMDNTAAPGIFKEAHCDAILANSAFVVALNVTPAPYVTDNAVSSANSHQVMVTNTDATPLKPNASPPATVANVNISSRNGINLVAVTAYLNVANIKVLTVTEGGVPNGAELAGNVG